MGEFDFFLVDDGLGKSDPRVLWELHPCLWEPGICRAFVTVISAEGRGQGGEGTGAVSLAILGPLFLSPPALSTFLSQHRHTMGGMDKLTRVLDYLLQEVRLAAAPTAGDHPHAPCPPSADEIELLF